MGAVQIETSSPMKLLHLDAGIQGNQSISRMLSEGIVARFRAQQPDLTYTYHDLIADPLPHLSPRWFDEPEAKAALGAFLAADVVVLGVGMYNFGVPSQLKAWIDRILIAGRTFKYTEQGSVGLASKKRVYVALSRGGEYSEGPAVAAEHAESYLRTIFAFVGIQTPTFIIAEGHGAAPDRREIIVEGARAETRELSL